MSDHKSIKFDLTFDSHIKMRCKLKFDKVSPKIEEVRKFGSELRLLFGPIVRLVVVSEPRSWPFISKASV